MNTLYRNTVFIYPNIIIKIKLSCNCVIIVYRGSNKGKSIDRIKCVITFTGARLLVDYIETTVAKRKEESDPK